MVLYQIFILYIQIIKIYFIRVGFIIIIYYSTFWPTNLIIATSLGLGILLYISNTIIIWANLTMADNMGV